MLHNWPYHEFSPVCFEDVLLFSPMTFFILFLFLVTFLIFFFFFHFANGTKSMSMASSPSEFFLPFLPSDTPFASPRYVAIAYLFTSPRDSRIMTKIWRAQRWFPSDAFRIFQERVFPPRQAVTLAAGWLQKSLSHHLASDFVEPNLHID